MNEATDLWINAEYRISCYEEYGDYYYRPQVIGLSNGTFGINGKDREWVITHLNSGMACFRLRSMKAAKQLAEHLTATYKPQFDLVEAAPDSFRVTNFKQLFEDVLADPFVTEMRQQAPTFASSGVQKLFDKLEIAS